MPTIPTTPLDFPRPASIAGTDPTPGLPRYAANHCWPVASGACRLMVEHDGGQIALHSEDPEFWERVAADAQHLARISRIVTEGVPSDRITQLRSDLATAAGMVLR